MGPPVAAVDPQVDVGVDRASGQRLGMLMLLAGMVLHTVLLPGNDLAARRREVPQVGTVGRRSDGSVRRAPPPVKLHPEYQAPFSGSAFGAIRKYCGSENVSGTLPRLLITVFVPLA
ncbi:hypothetical protein GCM10010522_55820 [Kribbella solani]